MQSFYVKEHFQLFYERILIMNLKYKIALGVQANKTYLFSHCETPKEYIMCIFLGPNHKTDAQKVCDLLNETSRSQGNILNFLN